MDALLSFFGIGGKISKPTVQKRDTLEYKRQLVEQDRDERIGGDLLETFSIGVVDYGPLEGIRITITD